MMSPQLEDIVRKVRSDERIAPAEALVLWHEAPLWLLGELAARRKERVSGDKVYFNRNFHIEPTNLCVFNCNFCSYRRPKGSPEAWDYSLEEVERIARDHAGQGLTEVHIVGGVHPEHDLYYYVEMIRRVKAILPEATVKAFTAIELSYMIRKAGLTIDEGLRLLRSAGMEAIPGGGAEIFDEELRARICPDKGSTAEWFEVHAAAHRLGIPTNATILYGHIECVEHRIDHLDRLRSQQDLTGGFNAFIPLKYRNFGNPMSEIGEVSVIEDLRMLAMSRIYLDNIPHVKAYWVMYGKATTELALAFGADDIDGTIDDTTRIYSMAGAEDRKPSMSIDDMHRIVRAAGYRAGERDTFYNEILPFPAMEKLAYYWKRLRQNRLAYNLVLIGAIILAMAVAAHIVMQVGTRHGARRTVPDFSGVKLDQAQRMARKCDLKLHISDSLFVPAYEGGIVLDQLPEGGVEVKPGRTVYITINSFRQKMVPVPYVAGRSLRQAKNMLEIAGLEIDELVYRADMATNYVLDEYCDGRPVAATSKIEAELGSGVTLYVGVEGGYGTTVVPRLVGFPLKEAKGRLWELGLYVGKVDFDEVINLLNQKDARVYIQHPTAERRAGLGSRVDLRLTLDEKKLAQHRAIAEKQAKEAAEERLQSEREHADSLAQAEFERAAAGSAEEQPADEPAAAGNDEGFFD